VLRDQESRRLEALHSDESFFYIQNELGRLEKADAAEVEELKNSLATDHSTSLDACRSRQASDLAQNLPFSAVFDYLQQQCKLAMSELEAELGDDDPTSGDEITLEKARSKMLLTDLSVNDRAKLLAALGDIEEDTLSKFIDTKDSLDTKLFAQGIESGRNQIDKNDSEDDLEAYDRNAKVKEVEMREAQRVCRKKRIDFFRSSLAEEISSDTPPLVGLERMAKELCDYLENIAFKMKQFEKAMTKAIGERAESELSFDEDKAKKTMLAESDRAFEEPFGE